MINEAFTKNMFCLFFRNVKSAIGMCDGSAVF
jgi:hypothetical protein